MANDYDKTLERFKKLQENGATDTMAAAAQPAQRPKQSNAMMGDISSLNEAVFGKYNPETDNSTSDGQKILMETMKEFESGNVSEDTMKRVRENVKNSKIPQAILQSVISNPLIETKIGNTDVDDYMDNLMKQNANIQASKRINEKLNETDNSKAQQLNISPATNSRADFDYGKLQQIVEEIMDRKFAQYISKIGLNESKQPQAPSIKAIQEVDGSRFLLADTSDNVYECTLVYKGKNTRKK